MEVSYSRNCWIIARQWRILTRRRRRICRIRFSVDINADSQTKRNTMGDSCWDSRSLGHGDSSHGTHRRIFRREVHALACRCLFCVHRRNPTQQSSRSLLNRSAPRPRGIIAKQVGRRRSKQSRMVVASTSLLISWDKTTSR
jgi:hypothetical protein